VSSFGRIVKIKIVFGKGFLGHFYCSKIDFKRINNIFFDEIVNFDLASINCVEVDYFFAFGAMFS